MTHKAPVQARVRVTVGGLTCLEGSVHELLALLVFKGEVRLPAERSDVWLEVNDHCYRVAAPPFWDLDENDEETE